MTHTPDTTEYRNEANDHGAVRYADGLVVFGFWTSRGAFMVSYAKPSKRYGTLGRGRPRDPGLDGAVAYSAYSAPKRSCTVSPTAAAATCHRIISWLSASTRSL